MTVSQAAEICRVGRTTVGYWIRSGKLFAQRSRRNYTIPVDELLYFLKARGHQIPAQLKVEGNDAPIYKRFQYCWDYWQKQGEGRNCRGCLVARQKIADCFTLPPSQVPCRRSACHRCRYYLDLVAVRVQFVHQMEAPAVIFKYFSVWAANSRFATLCGQRKSSLIGIGIEQLVHPDSLAEVVAVLKQLALAKYTNVNPCRIAIFDQAGGKLSVDVLVLPLNEPAGTWLATVTNH